MKHGTLIDYVGFLQIYKQTNSFGDLILRYVDSTSEDLSDYFEECYDEGQWPDLTTSYFKMRIEQAGY